MHPELAGLIERAEHLSQDLGFTAAREWKAAEPDRKVVGHLPIYVPREILHAAGILPVSVLGGGDQLEIIRGDAFFQSYICHIPRSVIEMALSGRLELMDGMLFPSICDVIRNLSGMWKMLFPDRYVRYMDVPQNFDPRVGGEFWHRELSTLRDEMEELAGCEIDDEALRASIVVYNENRRALAALYEARSRRPWKYPTPEFYQVVKAGAVIPPEDHTRMLTRYLELAGAEEDRVEMDLSRVVVRGAFCEQPSIGLLVTLERAGCWVVDDDLLLGLRWFTEPIPEAGDPLRNLSDAYLSQSPATASKYEPEKVKGKALVEAVASHDAEGVIFAAPSFCDPALLDQPMLAAALDSEGIPYTQFKYSEDMGQFAVIREQTGTFADSIRLWSREMS